MIAAGRLELAKRAMESNGRVEGRGSRLEGSEVMGVELLRAWPMESAFVSRFAGWVAMFLSCGAVEGSGVRVG